MMVYTSQISKKEVDWINEKKVIERIKFKFCLKSTHVQAHWNPLGTLRHSQLLSPKEGSTPYQAHFLFDCCLNAYNYTLNREPDRNLK